MIMAQEQAILKAQEQFAQIQDFVRQAGGAGRRIDQVESDLWGRILQLGGQLLEGYVAGYRQGDLGPTLEQDGGQGPQREPKTEQQRLPSVDTASHSSSCNRDT